MNKNKIISFYSKSSYLLLLGVIHCVLTPVFYKSLSLNSLWFFGTGMALTYLAVVNIIASRVLGSMVLTLALIANIFGTTFSVILTYVLKEPQAYVGLLFHLVVLFASILTYKNMKRYEFTL